MTFVQDVTPLLSPSLRFVALWIEIVTCPLSIFSLNIIWDRIIACALAFFLVIIDATVGIRRYKARNHARSRKETYTLRPSGWMIAVDMIFGLLFLAIYALELAAGYISGLYAYNGIRGVLFAHAWMGILAIAHLHFIFGFVELSILRKQRRSRNVGAPAEEVAHNSTVEEIHEAGPPRYNEKTVQEVAV